MLAKASAVLFGDYDSAKWHPANGIDGEIAEILQDELVVTCTEDYGPLTRGDLEQYAMVISYADCWQEKTSPNLVHAVLSYVSGGGSLMAIHNGIFMQEDFELAQMLGAKFTKHPEYTVLDYVPISSEHPIIEGMTRWSMGEEPYQFVFDDFCKKEIFLEYIYEDQSWPAGWTIEYGLGRIVYLAPGHDIRSFQNTSFREIILRSSRWARRLI